MAFLLFGAVGVVATLQSVHFERSLFFLIWTLGTILMIPILVSEFYKQLGSFIPKSLVIYFTVVSFIVCLDLFLTRVTDGSVHIGNVDTLFHNVHKVTLYRPHGFYQEPAYFTVFALLMLVFVGYWKRQSLSKPWTRFCLFSQVLGLGAILVSGSRVGYLGLMFLFGFMVFKSILSRINLGSFRPRKSYELAAFALVLLIFGAVLFTHWESYEGLFSVTMKQNFQDHSFLNRFERIMASIEVYSENIFIGAGPGAAGAYLIDSGSSLEWTENLKHLSTDIVRNDPLSQSIFTEIMSEWGILGYSAFFMGLILMFSHLSVLACVQLIGLVFVCYTATQTLPRFDLWIVLGGIAAIGPSEKRMRIGAKPIGASYLGWLPKRAYATVFSVALLVIISALCSEFLMKMKRQTLFTLDLKEVYLQRKRRARPNEYDPKTLLPLKSSQSAPKVEKKTQITECLFDIKLMTSGVSTLSKVMYAVALSVDDSPQKLKAYPEKYLNADLILLSNKDLDLDLSSYLEFQLKKRAEVIVAYHHGTPFYPGWLRHWEKIPGENIWSISGVKYDLFRKTYKAGEVKIPSNQNSWFVASKEHYFVMVRPVH